MAKDYQKEAPNARAVCQTASWLKAVGIGASLGETADTDLLVTAKDGRQIRVRIALGEEMAPVAAADCVTLLAKEITAKDSTRALQAFHILTEAAGFGAPVPVNRGPAPTQKLHYGDNPELVMMRHNEFRRVPNPDPAELKVYDKVMRQACYSFINRNQGLCQRHCLLVEDLMTYAMVWTTNYLGLYRVLRETVNDNHRKLRAHLNQRFAEFAATTQRKERNVLPSPDTVHIALLGKPVDENHKIEGFSFNPTEVDEVDESWVAEHSEIDTSSEEARRLSAAQVLRQRLSALPHDQMIGLLEGAIANTHLDLTARHEAGRQLRLHRKCCEACGGKKPETNPQKEKPMDENVTTLPPTESSAPKAPRASNADLFPAQREAFIKALPPTRKCPKCGKEKANTEFGIRLMNGKQAADGSQEPVFRVQAQCRSCRSVKKMPEAPKPEAPAVVKVVDIGDGDAVYVETKSAPEPEKFNILE